MAYPKAPITYVEVSRYWGFRNEHKRQNPDLQGIALADSYLGLDTEATPLTEGWRQTPLEEAGSKVRQPRFKTIPVYSLTVNP